MGSKIPAVDLASRGIRSTGFDYSRIEDVFADIGPMLIRPHRHEFYEILWFTHGEGKHYLDLVSYPIDPPIMFFVARNQIHRFDERDDWKGHMLRFSEDYIWRHTEGHDAMSRGSLFGVGRQPLRIHHAEDAASLDCIIQQIDNEKKRAKDNLQPDLLYHLTNALLIQAKRLAVAHLTDINFNTRRDMCIYHRFFELMERHYLDHYQVSQYADQVGVCAKRLTEICKTVTGKSAKQVIKERLVLEAKRYLQFSELSVKEISDKLNFNDYCYFSRFFTEAVKMPPSNFRNLTSELCKK